MDLREIHKDTQNRGGAKEIQINSRRGEEKGEERAREKRRRNGERDQRRREEREEGRKREQRQRGFHTCGPRALKPPTSTPKPKCISQNRLGSYFRPSPRPASAVPGALIHSCPLLTMTFEPGKIIALEQITYNQ